MPEDLEKEYRDKLINFYHEFNSNRIDYNTRKWETVKFFTSLYTALITATVAISTNINPDSKSLLYILPISAIIVSYFGGKNLERESELLFKQEVSMFKIEKYLGLHDEIPEDKRLFRCDPYLIPQKHRDTLNSVTADNWVNVKMQEHKFLKIMKGVFRVEIVIAVALIALIYHL